MLVHQSDDFMVIGCTNTDLKFDCDSWSSSWYVFFLGGKDTH